MTILAIDSDYDSLRQLADCLATVSPQAEILPFSDPFIAIKYFFNNPIDAVYTKVELKHMNGIKMMEGVHKQFVDQVPVYFVAAAPQYRDIAITMGADGYWTKPITKDTIRRAIRKRGSICCDRCKPI